MFVDEWIGILAPPIITIAVIGVVRFFQRSSSQGRHARVLAELGAPEAAKDLFHQKEGHVVTFEGALAADEKDVCVASLHPTGTSLLDEPNAYAITWAPNGQLRVELDGGARAILDGEFQVIRGSLETSHDTPLARVDHPAAARLAELSPNKRVGQVRFLNVGDRVRVRGVVALAPDNDASYRDESRVVRVTPAPGDARGAPRVIALASVSVPVEMRTRSRAGVAIFGSVLASVAVAALIVPHVHVHAGPSDSAPLIVEKKPAPPGCRAATQAAFDANQWEKAVQNGLSCNDPQTVALTHFARGEFIEASNAFADATAADPDLTPSVTETEAHLFAHKLDRAALSAHRMVTHFYPGPPTAERGYLECIAKHFDDLAATGLGDDRGSKYPYRYPCGDAKLPRLAAELEAEGGMSGSFERYEPSYEAVGNSFTAAVAPRGRLFGRPIGLEHRELDRLLLHPGPTRQGVVPRQGNPDGKLFLIWETDAGDRFVQLSSFAAELELFYGYAGFPERSRDLWPITDRIASSLESSPVKHFTKDRIDDADSWKRPEYQEQEMLVHEMAIASAAAFLSGDAARMERYAKVGDTHSSGVVLQLARMTDPKNRWEKAIEDSHWGDHQALFDAMETGDANSIVAHLTEQHATGRDTLARIVPRVGDREAFQPWFRDHYPPPCLTCGGSAMLGYLSDRREVARILGGAAEAERARLTEPAKKFVDALTDDDIAWELAELDAFFARGK